MLENYTRSLSKSDAWRALALEFQQNLQKTSRAESQIEDSDGEDHRNTRTSRQNKKEQTHNTTEADEEKNDESKFEQLTSYLV